MKYKIIYIIGFCLFSCYTYSQKIKNLQNYIVTGSNPNMLQITPKHTSWEGSTMARFQILNEQFLIESVQKTFFKSLKEIGKFDVMTKRLKAEFDSLKTESSVTLIYKANGEIVDMSFCFSQFVIERILSENDIKLISNNIKTYSKIEVEANNGHIYLDKYDSDWQIKTKKKKIPITEYYKEYSRSKGYKDYYIQLVSNKRSPATMGIIPITPITDEQTMGMISVNNVQINEIVSTTIKNILIGRNKYDLLYCQLKKEFEENNTNSNVYIWYNGKGNIRNCIFYVSSVVLDNILVEEDFKALSKALKNTNIEVKKDPKNGYTKWGDYDPNWEKGIKLTSIPIIHFQSNNK